MSIHGWSAEQKRVLVDEFNKTAASEEADPNWVHYLGQILQLAGIPNTAEFRKAVLLGSVLHAIGGDTQ